jgi:hypothetical protein
MTTVTRGETPILDRARAEGLLRWAVLVCLTSGLAADAQGPPVHWLHAGAMPPGAIGSQRLLRDGPLSGYFQPVRIRAPKGARISLAEEGGFGMPQADSLLAGMQIGGVYRFRMTEFGSEPGQEVFPTVEVIDRLYPPAGLALRYPIPVELTAEELELAARGNFVTRVIYLEDPNQSLPTSQKDGEQPWAEAPQGADPLVVADELGRPVAILRIGGRVPTANDPGCGASAPPIIQYDEPPVEGEVVPTSYRSRGPIRH